MNKETKGIQNMKSIARRLLVLVLGLTISTALTYGQGVTNLNVAPPVNNAASATAGPAGAVTTPSALLLNISAGPVYCQGALEQIHTTQFNLPASQALLWVYFRCPTNYVVVSVTPPVYPVDIPIATVVTGATTVGTITDLRAVSNFPNMADGYLVIKPEDCSLALTTGTYAANPANSGGQSAPAFVRTAAGSVVLQLTTTAAANTTELNCDIALGSRISAKGAVVSDIVIEYGYQTTALTTIGSVAANTLTFPVVGGAAGVTSAAAGGVITTTPGTSHSTPGAVTTSGQFYSEKYAFGTPIAVQTDLQRLLFTQTFAQSAAAATVFQFGGGVIHYQYPIY